ncbi:hypothetical protein PO878_04375 [Iamia majanohamensis]|uniref:Uncharacterized protein n=1 Tax=Iamia majanohamensis TaxID=467976 RepID=A0AAF0BWE3_9ACTN|nr:hypothetical protein [Iamia majanohamensis]WCO67958.1 hypothetical protein PO878_04375 [Iamia majanohamensis]
MVRGAAARPVHVTDRLDFERGARTAYPSLRGGPSKRTTGFRYVVTVDVPYYESRVVTVIFPPGSRTPIVLADGPRDSPHRYEDGGLCMWFPGDPPSMQWRFSHGLLDLLDAIRAHLFREAWWRQHDEWLGPEVGHRPTPSTIEEIA